MSTLPLRFRPVAEGDLALFQQLRTDPEFAGLDWSGFLDPGQPRRRFDQDGYLGADDGWLVVDADDGTTVALVNWRRGILASTGAHWEIGIVVLTTWRGRGIGWRAQAMLCDYLFRHTPVQRIQAGTHPENIAEQKALVKAGFQLEGVLRACEFRDGEWRDGLLYSRLRSDPAPAID
ncbi:GNAT family N-acetyltransferase [Cryptosporangium aurantiacum]|uniref:Protein N-acetyltransferase, RimJ/RimL family n=1 Tax=Cryptosporangium aurantiacum TaxID=134849 RepID=A0A1M7RDK2_9ACTN|nr:GNAT family protein [Cryptosporangium aurantiacum]SHN44304.1 Protein N-acetyltransferase, RimJ/RimL family [Cryptosporangium aurantiacum]